MNEIKLNTRETNALAVASVHSENLYDVLLELIHERESLRQQLAGAPAWHDRPTCGGTWVAAFGSAVEATKVVPNERDGGRLYMLSRLEPAENYSQCRWYGPVPPAQ